ncbi:hypothetical protein FS837_005048 [Tulasnella sp. UAMH 9824]|nr:hypothetical protein FS837_005048 [Tulasnella sp. UAMH 9824]
MWAQVLRVILTHPIAFIASWAVLVTLGDKVELARITTPPTPPVSPSPIVSSTYLSNELPFAEFEDFWSDALPQDFGSLEWFGLAAPTPGQSDFDDYQQEQDSNSYNSYSWPEALPVQNEPSNEDSNALQGQGQSEFNGEFEDPTITFSPIVPPSTRSGAARTSPTSHAGECFCGDGQLHQSKFKTKSDAAPSNEDPSQSPVAPVSDDFCGGTPILNLPPWVAGILALFMGWLIIRWFIVQDFDQLLAKVEVRLLRSRMKELIENHMTKARDIQERDDRLHEQNEEAYRTVVRLEAESSEKINQLVEEIGRRDEEIDRLKKKLGTPERISGGGGSASRQELDEGSEYMEQPKEDVAYLSAENKELSTRLGRESEFRFLMDTVEAHAERIRGSFVKNEQEVRKAHEAKFQAITEACEARKEAEGCRAAAEAAQFELESAQQQLAEFKENVEAARNETSIAMARVEALSSENTSLKKGVQKIVDATLANQNSQLNSLRKALAESEEKRANIQKEADATLANRKEADTALASLESRLNVLEQALAESEEKVISVQKEADAALAREFEKNAELGRRFDAANAHVQKLKESVTTLEREALEANEAKLQAVAEASQARKEAEASRQVAETARFELDAKLKEDDEEARNETSIARAQAETEAVISENATLKKALADSEQKTASVQKEADTALARLNVLEKAFAESEENTANVQNSAYAALANLESQLNAEKLANENLARDCARALALGTEARVEATPAGFEFSENSSVPVQPSGDVTVPTPVAEPQSSPAEDGPVSSSAPAPTSNPSGQSWLKPLGFTMEVRRATSFPKSEPGLFGISYGKESNELAQQEFDAVASCGGTNNWNLGSMEAGDSAPPSTNSGSIFGTGPATLPTPSNAPELGSNSALIEGPAAINQQLGAQIPCTTVPLEGPALSSDQQPVVPHINLQSSEGVNQLAWFLMTGVILPPSQDPDFAEAASFVGQDPNAVASQDMGALSSYGAGNNSGLNWMEMQSSGTSNMAGTFDYNAPASNTPTAVGATFNTTNTALGNPTPVGQEVAGDPESMAIYDSIIAAADGSPLPAPSQDPASTEVSSTMNQHWGPSNPGYATALGQEQSFDSSAVSQTPIHQNAQAALWNGQPALQQDQNLLWQQGYGAYTNVPQNPDNFLHSSQTSNFHFIPQSVPQLGNIAVQPNPLTMHPTSGPLTQSGPATISPAIFYNPARDSRYFTGNSPFAMRPNPSYVPAFPPTSYIPSAAPPFVPPVNQIPETTPTDSSQTANWTGPYSAPVAENNHPQPSYTGPAGDDEVSLGENDDEEWRQTYDASASQSRESAPSPELESRGPAGQDPLEGDWDKFEDDLDSYDEPGTGDVIIPISPPLNHVSEGDLPSAAHTPRPIRRLPRSSLRRAQVNEAGQIPNGTPVAAEVAADAGTSSDAWGATDDDQGPPTPPPNANGERAIRALPKSRRRQAASQMNGGN